MPPHPGALGRYAQPVGDVEAGWAFADVWVLAAIGVHRRRCSLVELIAAADWINHAVVLEDEFDSALGKLVGSGLVRVFDDWTFELTDDGTSLWAEDVRDVAGQLRYAEAGLSGLEPKRALVKLPHGAMNRAQAEYRNSRRG